MIFAATGPLGLLVWVVVILILLGIAAAIWRRVP